MLILTANRTRSPKAFSLIEVVLSLGVIAFSLVAILGVFPVGLSANRTSISDTRAAQVVAAITATIDAQGGSFNNVQCYGETLKLTDFDTSTTTKTFYVSYPSLAQPVIGNDAASVPDWIYKIDMYFDNDPSLTPSGVKLGPGKLNKIQLRLRGRSTTEGFVEEFYLARNKG